MGRKNTNIKIRVIPSKIKIVKEDEKESPLEAEVAKPEVQDSSQVFTSNASQEEITPTIRPTGAINITPQPIREDERTKDNQEGFSQSISYTSRRSQQEPTQQSYTSMRSQIEKINPSLSPNSSLTPREREIIQDRPLGGQSIEKTGKERDYDTFRNVESGKPKKRYPWEVR